MLADKGFAYLRLPGLPIYIGDIACLTSVAWILLFIRPLIRWRFTDVAPILAMLAYGALRLLPDLQPYGILALRDSVVLTYAYIALLAFFFFRDRSDVRFWLSLLVLALAIHTLLTPVFLLTNLLTDPALLVRSEEVPLFVFKPTDHCNFAALSVALFVVAQAGPFALPAGLLTPSIVVNWLFIALSLVRGAYLGFLTVLLTMTVFRYARKVLAVTGVIAVLASILLLADPSITIRHRTISPAVIAEELQSIFVDRSYNYALVGTKHWRLDFWRSIIADSTRDLPTVVFGVGNGPNLAAMHNFVSEYEGQLRALRSPHSVELTVYARFGLLGFLLWTAVHVHFFRSVLVAIRITGSHQLTDLHLALWASLVYVSMALVNASFDVMLEGPQTAVWYWFMIGAGLAIARMTRRLGLLSPTLAGDHPDTLSPMSISRHIHRDAKLCGA